MKLEEKAYTYIKNKIQTLQWLPGYQIREQDISKSLNISRTPIRNAFKRLKKDGYIKKVANKGVFVTEIVLSKKEFQDRMEFIETMLIDYLQDLQRKDFDFPQNTLDKPLQEMKDSLTKDHEIFIEAEKDFWQTLLFHHDNPYEKGLILLTFNQSYSQGGYINQIISNSRKDKYAHMEKMTVYLADNDYPYTRREIRILFNQLILNIIQGSKDMYKG